MGTNVVLNGPDESDEIPILHYDGSTWSFMSSEASESLFSVWGSSGSDVFAVGENGSILHYDGSAWSFMSSGTTEDLLDVWGSSEKNVFAVGNNGTILHYDGSAWTPMVSGSTKNLYGVWCNSAGTETFAVGDFGTVFHYDGITWSEKDSGLTEMDLPLFNIWGSSENNVFTVGAFGLILRYDGVPTAEDNCPEHYNPGQEDSDQDGIGDACESSFNCPFEAIFGEHSIEAELLRSLRDNVLSQTQEGQELIKLYYQWGPVIVRAMEADEDFKEGIKDIVDRVLGLIGK